LHNFSMIDHDTIRIGATSTLNLRVSVATLARVLFDHPEEQRTMIALERTATFREIEGRAKVLVKVKPFGGGVRLTHPAALKQQIGDFNYDSEKSCQEKDFRLQIHPKSWPKIKKICRMHLINYDCEYFDSSPHRELAEELEDSLKTKIDVTRYKAEPEGMIVENTPVRTDSERARGQPTVRIYFLYEIRLKDFRIINLMLNNNRYSYCDLQNMAGVDFRKSGRGRANAVLLAGLEDLKNLYGSIPKSRRGDPTPFGNYQLEGSVVNLLEGIGSTKFKRYGS
jgi:hypothetical protein